MTTRTLPLRIDLNGDLGEWDSSASGAAEALRVDEALMESLTSVNIACGGHAGDGGSMRAIVRLARDRGLGIGAHPGFADRAGFGRRPIAITPAGAARLVSEQVEALRRIARTEGARVDHVKPHGALYSMASTDAAIAGGIADAVARIDPTLVLVGLSGSALSAAGRYAGLPTASEVFCDRGYTSAGTLVPRGEEGSLLDDPLTAAERLLRMLRTGVVSSRDGTDVSVLAETACIHGDSAAAAVFARRLRTTLEAAGVAVERFTPGRIE